MSGLTELPSTAATSLGPDKVDRIPYLNEAYRAQSFLLNKIRVYLIQIGEMLGLGDGSTPGSIAYRLNLLEAKVGAPAPIKITGVTQQAVNVIGSEVRIGAFGAFQPAAYANPSIAFEATFMFSPATAGSAEIRLYDMGTRAAPTGGTLRSTIAVPFTDVGVHKCVSRALTATLGPGVNTDTIADAERVYEVRAILIGANPGDVLEIDNAALSVVGTYAGGTYAPNSPGYLVLGAATGLLNARNPVGPNSIELVDGGPGGSLTVRLKGDVATPGNNKVYGTDGAGVLGYKPDPTSGGGAAAFQWNAGGTQDPSHGAYNNWADLYAAVSLAPYEARVVRVNAQDSIPLIPAGNWNLNGWHFMGPGPGDGNLVFDDGAIFDLPAAIATAWSPNDARLKLTFENLYVETWSLAGNTNIDMGTAAFWTLHLHVIDAEIDAFSGGSFIRNNSVSNGVRCHFQGGTFFGSGDGVLDTGNGYNSIVASDRWNQFNGGAITGLGFLNIVAFSYVLYETPRAFAGTYNFYDYVTPKTYWGQFDGASGYTGWADLYAYVSALPAARRVVYVDSSAVTLNIPSGTWDLTGWRFIGVDPAQTSITFLNGGNITVGTAGATFENITVISNLTAPIVVTGAARTDLWLINCAVNAVADVLFDATGAAADVHLHTRDVDSSSGFGLIYWASGANGYLHLDGRLDTNATTFANGVGHTLSVAIDSPAINWTTQTGLLGTVNYDVTYAKKNRYAVQGAAYQLVPFNVLTPEVVVGGFVYNPKNPLYLPGQDGFPMFEAMATTPTVNAVVKLYDIGAPGALAAPTLVSTKTVINGQGSVNQLLVVNAAPTPASDEIYDVERLYEVRVVSDAVEDIQLYWAGIKVN